MPKFKIGETVRCLPVQPKVKHEYRGYGFKANKSFVIREITQPNSKDPIYWSSYTEGGVYEHELEENDWDG